jgi:hypothetical protein
VTTALAGAKVPNFAKEKALAGPDWLLPRTKFGQAALKASLNGPEYGTYGLGPRIDRHFFPEPEPRGFGGGTDAATARAIHGGLFGFRPLKP